MTTSSEEAPAEVNSTPPRDDVCNEHSEAPRPAKRARVALACQRCKTRKQKCNGHRPSCSNCWNSNAECKYVPPPKVVSHNRDQYAKAAEDRVAELEAILLQKGISDEGRSEWEKLRTAQHSRSSESAAAGDNDLRRRSFAKRPATDGSPDKHHDTEGEWEAVLKDGEVTRVVDILRDLSLEASGGYVGASSSITMSRMMGSLVRGKEGKGFTSSTPLFGEHLSPKSTSDGASTIDVPLDVGDIRQEVADRLLRGYLKHISTRWPVLHSRFVRDLHSRRDCLGNSYERSVLHLVYAIGGRFLETTGETGEFYAESHHSAGMQHLEEIMQYHNVNTIQLLVLLAIYSLRAPKGPGAWTYIGLAMRICIDIGLHRHVQKKRYPTLELEMRKRIFWTCYCLDRQVSIILGRPFAISDRDLDIELPLDVDESCEDSSILEAAYDASKSPLPISKKGQSSSMACFIHICRLRRIESQIHQCIYRVDQLAGPQELEVEMFMRQLDDWKANIPRDARHPVLRDAKSGMDTMVVDGHDYYMVYYYKCLRFLLHPYLSTRETHGTLLKKCAEACGGVCQTYKRLHQSVPIGFSLMALHSVFLSGLTLVYYTWISPKDVFNITTSNDMNACSIVLFIITERWPGAKKYRDAYEAIKQSVLESVQNGEYEPRRKIRNIAPDLLQTMDRDEEGSLEATRMVAEMSGHPLPMDEDMNFSSLPSASMLNGSGIGDNLSPHMEGFDFSMLQETSGLHEDIRFDESMVAFNSNMMDGFDIDSFNMESSRGAFGLLG